MNKYSNIIRKTLTPSNLGRKGMHDTYITVPKGECDRDVFFGSPLPLKVICTDKGSGIEYVFPYKKENNGEYRLSQFREFCKDSGASVGDVVVIERKPSSSGDIFEISLEALTDLALTNINEYPDEIDSNKYPEGGKKTVVVNKYERNNKARKECIDYHGAICSCCDLNFTKMYGEIGDGYIHVHHIKPVSEIEESYNVDPINDLIPVCPNCHAMIHKRKPPYSPDEIKSFLKKQQPY